MQLRCGHRLAGLEVEREFIVLRAINGKAHAEGIGQHCLADEDMVFDSHIIGVPVRVDDAIGGATDSRIGAYTGAWQYITGPFRCDGVLALAFMGGHAGLGIIQQRGFGIDAQGGTQERVPDATVFAAQQRAAQVQTPDVHARTGAQSLLEQLAFFHRTALVLAQPIQVRQRSTRVEQVFHDIGHTGVAGGQPACDRMGVGGLGTDVGAIQAADSARIVGRTGTEQAVRHRRRRVVVTDVEKTIGAVAVFQTQGGCAFTAFGFKADAVLASSAEIDVDATAVRGERDDQRRCGKGSALAAQQ